MKFIILVSGLMLLSAPTHAQTDKEIEEQCKSIYPSLTQLFKKNECVAEAKKKIAEARANEKKEEEARPCLARQIPSLEDKLKSLMKDILPTDSLEVAANKVAKVTGNKSSITPSEANIKNMVAINWLVSTCKSDFYYLINVIQGEDGKLSSFKVWTENPPKGYTNNHANGYRPEFYVDYSARRRVSEERNRSVINRDTASNSDYLNPKSHCAPNISMKERINRLGAHGEVTQSSERAYKAGKHAVGFHFDGTLSYCY